MGVAAPAGDGFGVAWRPCAPIGFRLDCGCVLGARVRRRLERREYPIPLGYDAQGHVDYADVLLDHKRLPTKAEASEYRQPPGYYAIAGGAAALGQMVFGWHEDKPYSALPETSYRGAQYLNVLFVLTTGVLLLLLARLVAPTQPSVWAAALLFFAFLPVVAKTEAMFHPEPLNMLLATASVWLTTRILIAGRFTIRGSVGLALLLAADSSYDRARCSP